MKKIILKNERYTNRGAATAISYYTRQIRNYRASGHSKVEKEWFRKKANEMQLKLTVLQNIMQGRKAKNITVYRTVEYYMWSDE